MKKIKLIFFVAILGLLFASCKSDITEVVVSSSPTSPGQVNATNVTFDVDHRDSTITFTWAAADFGFQSSTTYIVQMSLMQNFSSNVSNVLSTQNLTGKVKVSDLNTLILSWNIPIGTATTVYYRVAATVSSKLDTIYSNSGSMDITPYDAVINYPMVYVPGDYQGWAPDQAVNTYSVLYSYDFNSTYSSIVRLVNTGGTQTNFKVTSDPDWNHTNYGLATLTQTGVNYDGTCTTDPSAGNFTVDNGMYVLTIDVNALTITLTRTDDWGIIGSSIPPYDWSADVDMNYNGQRQMWEITGDFKAGEFKFRANNDWSLAYGDGGNGTLSSDGGAPNLQLAADGNYTIRFDPVALTYTVEQN